MTGLTANRRRESPGEARPDLQWRFAVNGVRMFPISGPQSPRLAAARPDRGRNLLHGADMGSLFAKKPIESAQVDARTGCTGCSARGHSPPWGSGRSSGPGSSSPPGRRPTNVAGPALMVSYVLAGFTCLLAALCYAEFAAMTPVAGSAYTYAYTTLGELFAWIIGWDLILEYAVGAATVANGWSSYFQRASSASSTSILPAHIGTAAVSLQGRRIRRTNGFVNLPAVLIVALTDRHPGEGDQGKRHAERGHGGSRSERFCS